MNPGDGKLIEQIQQATRGGSRVLVTLARRGKAIERDDPERAALLLGAVATHPLYKGGRLTFDMLEIEDLMLDGSPADPMSTPELVQMLNASGHQLAETLIRMGSAAQGGRMPTDVSSRNADMLDSPVSPGGQSADEPAAAILPRLSLGPSDDGGPTANVATARSNDGGTGTSEPELKSSDYLYDYVVLGLLEVVGGMRMFRS